MRDAGNLLTRAGFNLPGVDVDEYVVRYRNGEYFTISCITWSIAWLPYKFASVIPLICWPLLILEFC